MSVQLSDVRKTPSRIQQIIELLFSIFLRLLAVIFFAGALYVWMTAVGYWEGPNYRFDTMGVALKITDGTTRASECAIAAILVSLGVLEADHPATRKFMNATQYSRRGLECGVIRPAPGFPG